MKETRNNAADSHRAPDRRPVGAGPDGAAGSPGPGKGLYAALVGAPVVIFGAIILLQGRGAPQPPPVTGLDEEEEYRRYRVLLNEAEPHISLFFRAKRDGKAALVQSEYAMAKEKLVSAMEVLERLKSSHTDDGTLDGKLPEEYRYLDRELQELQEKYSQIIREKDVGE